MVGTANSGLGYEGRFEYPNRCQAHHAGDKKPCGAWAMRGSTVCYHHGGMAPQTLKAADERITAATAFIQAKIFDAMERHGIRGPEDFGLPPRYEERLKRFVAKQQAKPPPPPRPTPRPEPSKPKPKPSEAKPEPLVGIAWGTPRRPRQPDDDRGRFAGGPAAPPSFAREPMPRPGAGEVPDRDTPPRSGPPTRKLMTLEDPGGEPANRA